MLYRVDEFMPGSAQDTKDEASKPALRLKRLLNKIYDSLVIADPNRLETPVGQQVVDIYRKAYVNGGLTKADARRVHWIWFFGCLRTLPSVLMILMPSILLVALQMSQLLAVPAVVWTAVLFSTAADVILTPFWYLLVSAPLHARGVSVPIRTLIGFIGMTAIVTAMHQGLHLLMPDRFLELQTYILLLLPFQLMVFWVYHFGFDVHVDYSAVTRRWTDTPLQRLLPYDKRGKLVFLRAADHYVIVRTTKGEHDLRMRFSDALERLGNARGLQVHRSFWVAQDFLTSPRREGRRMVMHVDGVLIPISATYREAVTRHLDIGGQTESAPPT